MDLHYSTFEYLKPTDIQMEKMAECREEFKKFVMKIDNLLAPGSDKDYVIRQIRNAAMWANVTITRYDDGTPRP